MEMVSLIISVSIIHLFAVISPGPDFIMCCRNSLTYSRKTGIWTAVGFGMGTSVHIFYSIAGLALIISKSILLFNTIKYLGAAYLIYIGLKSILSKSSKIDLGEQYKKADISHFAAIRIGFLTNVLNPKVSLFFLSLFTLVISPKTPMLIMGIMTIIMVATTILWFSLVSILLTQEKIRSFFERFQGVINKTSGGLLIAFGIKIALIEK